MDDKQYLLSQNNIVQDGHKVKNKELYALLKQKPNKKIIGFIPMYLNIYNFATEKDEDHLRYTHFRCFSLEENYPTRMHIKDGSFRINLC